MHAAFVRAAICSCLALPCLAWAQQQAIAKRTTVPTDDANQVVVASNGEGEPGRFVVTVSVSDNSEDSALNADDVIEAVVRPRQYPELHALLGSPQSTRRTFDYMPALDGAEDEYVALIGTMRHYVDLTYREEARLDETLRRLREDPRFAYLGRQTPPGFSAAPNDPYFAGYGWRHSIAGIAKMMNPTPCSLARSWQCRSSARGAQTTPMAAAVDCSVLFFRTRTVTTTA